MKIHESPSIICLFSHFEMLQIFMKLCFHRALVMSQGGEDLFCKTFPHLATVKPQQEEEENSNVSPRLDGDQSPVEEEEEGGAVTVESPAATAAEEGEGWPDTSALDPEENAAAETSAELEPSRRRLANLVTSREEWERRLGRGEVGNAWPAVETDQVLVISEDDIDSDLCPVHGNSDSECPPPQDPGEFILRLPEEVWLLIMRGLSQSELCNLGLACRPLLRLSRDPSLWPRVSLLGDAVAGTRTVTQLLARVGGGLLSLSVTSRDDVSQVLGSLAASCHNLLHLDIKFCQPLTFGDLTVLAAGCPKLQTINLEGTGIDITRSFFLSSHCRMLTYIS